MKLFFWKLNEKEKLIRSTWTGLLSLLILITVCWYYLDNFKLKILVPMMVAIIWAIELLILFKGWKKSTQASKNNN